MVKHGENYFLTPYSILTVSAAEICHVNPLKIEADSPSQIPAREMASKQDAGVKYLL